MRFKIFQTDKPRRFSFHTRYYEENKISSDDKPVVEKGSFNKYRNRYDTEIGPSRAEDAKRRRLTLLISVIVMLGLVYMIIRFSNTLERVLTLLLQ